MRHARAILLALTLAALACSSLPVRAPDAAVDASADGAVSDAGPCPERCADGVECIHGVCSRRVAQVASELDHVCARLVDGSVWCWGTNESGEVGDGSLEATRPLPSRVPGVTAAYVAAAWSRSCAIDPDGRVWCWGANSGRCIADDARAVVRAPEAVPFPGRVTALTLGPGICALLSDGAVYCRGEFGGVVAQPSLRWTDHVVAIAGGWGHLCALHDDGAVSCGGRRGYGQFGDGDTALAGMDYVLGPVRPLGLPRASALASSAEGACALAAGDGALWCWGTNTHGDLSTRWSPERVELPFTPRALWSRRHGFIARDAEGSLRAWGRNVAGGVGDGTTVNRWPPVEMRALGDIAAEAVSFAGGLDHTCALLRDQTVRCWGGNGRGQLGLGTLDARELSPRSPRW